MRKDKGLNGDLDRLPLLTWIMFLKFLDDLEQQSEGEAKLAGKAFKPLLLPHHTVGAIGPSRLTVSLVMNFYPLSTAKKAPARTVREGRGCSTICAACPVKMALWIAAR